MGGTQLGSGDLISNIFNLFYFMGVEMKETSLQRICKVQYVHLIWTLFVNLSLFNCSYLSVM